MTVYPCTYRELPIAKSDTLRQTGISLYLQGTLDVKNISRREERYIPVPTGNSWSQTKNTVSGLVYPCTYRELANLNNILVSTGGISLYLQGTQLLLKLNSLYKRYIPVPTGNSLALEKSIITFSVYPCTYRELFKSCCINFRNGGISLYLQGTHQHHPTDQVEQRYIPVPTGNSFNISRTT